jgi:ABC-type dipeptide/oligopeptide/nickel transport system ATPase component
VGLLGLTGIALLGDHDLAASVAIAAGVAVLLASTIIEPATTRAAFRPDNSPRG